MDNVFIAVLFYCGILICLFSIDDHVEKMSKSIDVLVKYVEHKQAVENCSNMIRSISQ